MAEIDTTGLESQDAAHAKALKSMGSRVDPDTTPPADPAPADDPKDLPADPATPPASSEKPTDPQPQDPPATDPPQDPPADDPKDLPQGKRPERHIPIAQYHDEKKDWESKTATIVSEKDGEIARLTAELSKKNENPVTTDEEIKTFADQYGIDEAGLDQMTKILSKKILPDEKRELLDQLVIESEIRKENEFFHKEFEQIALPALKKTFGDIPADKLPEVEKFLDEAGHTKDFHDKELPYVIFQKQDEIKKLIGDIPKVDDKKEEKPVVRSMEPSRIGAGKPNSVTAKDLENTTDFTDFLALDQMEQNRLMKEMDTRTYQRLIAFSGAQKGTEVMRNGGKIVLTG